MTIYNKAKHRLETVDIEITEKNSTWFDDSTDTGSIYRITDFEGGLLIKQGKYDYPIWIDDVSRADIDHDHRKAQELLID
jgi:hypothetical protein